MASALRLGLSYRELLPLLPGRTITAIKIRGHTVFRGSNVKHFALWTDEQSNRLIEGYARGEPICCIAEAVDRSVFACRKRARYLDLRHPNTGAGRRYDKAEDRAIRKCFRAGLPLSEIVRRLNDTFDNNRTLAAIKIRAAYLGVTNRRVLIRARAKRRQAEIELRRALQSGATGRRRRCP